MRFEIDHVAPVDDRTADPLCTNAPGFARHGGRLPGLPRLARIVAKADSGLGSARYVVGATATIVARLRRPEPHDALGLTCFLRCGIIGKPRTGWQREDPLWA